MINMLDYLKDKKIIIVCGHYGAGKTNISVNLAVKLKQETGLVYTLADMDMVNPYFRSADNIKDLQKHGVDFIVPAFANMNVEVSTVPPEINSVFANQNKRVIIDIGGDDNGATVLGVFADKIKQENYEMIYVVNKYRPLTSNAGDAANLAHEIEHKSKLKITSLINNSNIGSMTTEKEVLNSIEYAQKISDSLNVNFLGTTAMISINSAIVLDFFEKKEYNIFGLDNYTKKLF